MKQLNLAILLLVFSCVFSSASAQNAPDWDGIRNGLAAFARSNPLRFIAQLTQMPPQAQKVYLAVIGEQLKQKTHMACNIFGGEASCMSLPSDTTFAQVCHEHDLKVDCAYYTDDLQEVRTNPVEELREALRRNGSAGLEENCEQCFDNMRRVWCAQTAPKCGSFQGAVQGAVLPAISTVLTASDNGRTPLDALSEAVPSLLQASNLALPCREMCESVVSTCSCNKERKFGDLLEKVDAAVSSGSSGLPPIPKGFTRQLFGALYDKPLCSLYAPSNTTGFTGHCDTDLRQQCTYPRKWCGQDEGRSNAGSDLVEELMALQVAKGLFGWVDSIWTDEGAVIDDADDEKLKKLEDKYLKHGSGSHPEKGLSASVAIPLICAVILVAGGVGFAYAYPKIVRARRQHQATLDELAGDDYDLLQPVYSPPGRESSGQ